MSPAKPVREPGSTTRGVVPTQKPEPTYGRCVVTFEPYDDSEPFRLEMPKAFMPTAELEVEEETKLPPGIVVASRVVGGTFTVKALRDDETGEVFRAVSHASS